MDEKKSNFMETNIEDENTDEIHGLSSCSPPSHSSRNNSIDSNSFPFIVSAGNGNKQRSLIISNLKRLKIKNPLILNIGGTKYYTSINTLLRYDDSIFYAMFSGKFLIKPNRDRSFFIDRDGKNFEYILNYLRTGHLIFDSNNVSFIVIL